MKIGLSPKMKRTLFAIMRGLTGGVICLAVKSLSLFFLMISAANQSFLFTNLDVPNYMIYIIAFAASVLIYGSVIGCICRYNPADFDSYFELEDHSLSFFGKMRYYLKSPYFYIELAPFLLIVFFAALLGACPEIFGMFYTGEGIAPHTRGILPAIVSIAIISPIFLYKKCDMIGYFDKLIKLREEEKVRGRVQPIVKILIICIIYPLLSPMLPLIPMVAISIFSIIVTTAIALTVGGFLGGIIFLIISIYAIRLVMRIFKRKSLVRKIGDTAAASDAKAADFENVYSSLLFRHKQMRFNIYAEKKVYNVLLISAISRRFPICFTSDRSGYHDRIVGMKHANFTVMHHYFGYEPKGDGIQILIICPEPKSVYIIEGNEKKRLYNAGKLYDFTAYDKDAFLGALRRSVLGKYDGQKKDEADKS